MGHEIAPGTSYCAHGHPIALDQIQFAPEPYPGGGFGAAPPAPYGPPPAVYGTPLPQPPLGFGGSDATVAHGMPNPPPDAVPPRALRGFLIAYGTNASGDFWPLTGGRLLVGRLGSAERVDIALQDPTISSRHATMLVDAESGTVAVEDAGSTNGTFVNDEHVGFNGRRELRDGDRVRFGAYTTIVKVIGRV
jgi:hypothetical protein